MSLSLNMETSSSPAVVRVESTESDTIHNNGKNETVCKSQSRVQQQSSDKRLTFGQSLAFVWYGDNVCSKLCNFILQYFFLFFRSKHTEMKWHVSTLPGKMAFARTAVIAKFIFDAALLAGTFEEDVLTDFDCAAFWTRASIITAVSVDVCAFCCSFIPWFQIHWQWWSAVFALGVICSVQLRPFCDECNDLVTAYTKSVNSSIPFCEALFVANFTSVTIWVAILAPPLRVLCSANVLNFVLTTTFLLDGEHFVVRWICANIGCNSFLLEMITIFFVVHVMFWLIELNSRTSWAFSKMLQTQNIRLDRLANPFSPDAFRTWLEAKRKMRERPGLHTSLLSGMSSRARLGRAPSTTKMSWDLDMSSFVLDEQPFAAGSSGQVYRGTYKGQEVAIKEMYSLMADQDTSFETGAELAVLSRLRHPNVLTWYGVVYMQSHNSVGIVTEFCGGGSLEDWIADPSCQRVPFVTLLDKAQQIARGMRYLHDDVNLAHRDLKPANVLLASQTGICKICDFGLSGMHVQANKSTVGTPQFMSPEVLLGEAMDLKRADVYAFSILLWQLLSRGCIPFEGCSTVTEMYNTVVIGNQRPDVASIDPGHGDTEDVLSSLLRKCWAREPSERPTFMDIVDVLAPMTAVVKKMGESDLS